MTLGPLLALAGALAAAPSEQTVVYYNARMALREGRAPEAVRLWLLRNALEDRDRRVSPHDADFRSVTWAALGDLGLCQDGFPRDEDGAGLWPLALHNQVVRNLRRSRPARRPEAFDAFEVGLQARPVSITDVLSARELSGFELSRGRCLLPWLSLVAAGEPINARLSDRQVAARLLRHLLTRARGTLSEQVRGRAVIEARLFDLDLQITALAAREARQQARDAGLQGRQLGVSRTGVAALQAEAPTTNLDPSSAAAGVLRAAASWPVDEWMSLSPDRRLFLFEAARGFGGDPGRFQAIGLEILDRVIAEGDGEGAERWIGLLAPEEGEAGARASVWGGERGERLLALDADRGFRERAVVAAHRGVDQLSRGDLPGALRSLAFARQHAAESQAAAALDGLSLRWVGYVAAQFEIDENLLVTLAELLPRRDYAVLLEDLLWSAAFHADARSFQVGLDHETGRAALGRRLALLRPLAAGDSKRFFAQVRAGLGESPSETLRFLEQLVARLELEDAGVRAAQVPTLRGIRTLLDQLVETADGHQGRVASAVLARALAIEEGLYGLPPEANARDRARALAPGGEVYAGSVRLAPADPLPWPFRPVETQAPSVFTPVELRPVEWRDAAGELVFGWSLRG